MSALEIDGLEDVDNSLKEQLKKAGLSSIRDIVIRGPVGVGKCTGLGMDNAADICNKASLLLEKLGVIPNDIGKCNSILKKEYIETGSAALDSLFGGKGIETGAITEFYGHSGSGKTQICISLCLMVQQLHPNYKAIYIDTEGKLRPERIAQIAHKKEMDTDKSKRNIKIARVFNTARLETLIQQDCCSEIAKDPLMKLLIVDSATSLYRAEYGERSKLPQRQHHLMKLMKTLQNIAYIYNIAVVITNQILTNPNDWGINSNMPVGGNAMAHSIAFRIRLLYSNPDFILARMVNSPCYPQLDASFAIAAGGITDISTLTGKN